MFVAIAARRLRLPYTVGLVLTGLALAFTGVETGLTLTHDVVFDLILPPLLFEAALNLHWRELRAELPLVLILSTLGVGLCALLVASGLTWGLRWPWGAAMTFGALIAATDPIAVIALLRETGVKGRLALLIESESLFNDGAAALLFTLVVGASALNSGATGWREIALQIALVGGGGVAIGLAVGGLAILMAGRSDDHLVETALTAVAAYGSFLTAEHLGASGVLATVCAGMVMGNLGVLAHDESRFSLSVRGREFVLAFWEFSAFLANTFVFLMIGHALAGVRTHSVLELGAVVLLALAGRAAAVYPLGLALSRSRWRTTLAEQHFLWWGGLRGALALALALALPVGYPFRDDILAGAFGVVAFSVIVQGLTAGAALKLLGLSPRQHV